MLGLDGQKHWVASVTVKSAYTAEDAMRGRAGNSLVLYTNYLNPGAKTYVQGATAIKQHTKEASRPHSRNGRQLNCLALREAFAS